MRRPDEPPSDKSAPTAAPSRVDPGVVAERVGDRTVVVHLDTNKIHELNATAARILELLRAGAERDGIVASLLAEYAVDEATAGREVDRLLEELRRRQISR